MRTNLKENNLYQAIECFIYILGHNKSMELDKYWVAVSLAVVWGIMTFWSLFTEHFVAMVLAGILTGLFGLIAYKEG